MDAAGGRERFAPPARDVAAPSGNITLGICAMAKKASSKPMMKILEHITSLGGVDVILFPEETILEKPIEEWPHRVDVLFSFFSEGFPLDKAEAYVQLRRPHCVNNLTAQRLLLDRRRVYALLEENGIPHPQALVAERGPEGELLGEAARHFSEAEDHLCIGDAKIAKPFVEKPVDAEDHNICIYYPSSMGGGVKRLFRKVGDQSSSYDPTVTSVRRDGTYMYEPFMKTQGTDIKIYTVGPEYAHAEARKSPVLDGVVTRDQDGKEVRVPVVLTPNEKEIARRVCLSFGQTVCGFDLLRTTADSYVIDVNGWSFVKGVAKYYEDAALVLHDHIMRAMGKTPMMKLRRLPAGSETPSEGATPSNNDKEPGVPPSRSDRWQHEELLAVLAVLRHGDRTPKNKMKITTTRSEFIQLHRTYAGGPRQDVKLKTPKQLQDVLDLTDEMLSRLPEGYGQQNDGEDCEPREPQPSSSGDSEEEVTRSISLDMHTVESLSLIRAVLKEGGHFDGIYRKVQIKPTAWGPDDKVEEVILILKYGGILTPAGEMQAETLGRRLRESMYPTELAVASNASNKASNGLLRLHATQRHDFKVYSSDEGRVQMSAAAFTRGLLDLDSAALTPICAALVETDPAMLDDLPHKAEAFLKRAKLELQSRITGEAEPNSPSAASSAAESGAAASRPSSPTRWERLTTPWLEAGLTHMPVMLDELRMLQQHLSAVCRELEALELEQFQKVACGKGGKPNARECCSVCSPLLIRKRWQKLQSDLFDSKTGSWNTAKVPEIYDAVKFDLIHQPMLTSAFGPLYDVAKKINDIMVPNEYGHDQRTRTKIGAMVCGQLVRKLLVDLSNSVGAGAGAATELPEMKIVTAVQYLKRIFALPKWLMPQKDGPPAQRGPSAGREEFREAELAEPDPRHAVSYMNTPHRRVRTRLYFTSESHIQTLMNVLRYCQYGGEHDRDSGGGSDAESRAEDGPAAGAGIVCGEAEDALRAEPVFDYLTHVVFRLYEDKRAAPGSPERHRVEVLFSPGASGHPQCSSHTMEVKGLRELQLPGKALTLAQLQKLLGPFAREPGSETAEAPAKASDRAPTPS